jgi:hypothetical protein
LLSRRWLEWLDVAGFAEAGPRAETVERVALNALAWRSGDGDSIQRLGGKPLHLDPRVSDPGLSGPDPPDCCSSGSGLSL